MMRKLFAGILWAFAAVTAAAQTSIQVQTHNVVDLNEQFNVTFVIEGENSASDFSWEWRTLTLFGDRRRVLLQASA